MFKDILKKSAYIGSFDHVFRRLLEANVPAVTASQIFRHIQQKYSITHCFAYASRQNPLPHQRLSLSLAPLIAPFTYALAPASANQNDDAAAYQNLSNINRPRTDDNTEQNSRCRCPHFRVRHPNIYHSSQSERKQESVSQKRLVCAQHAPAAIQFYPSSSASIRMPCGNPPLLVPSLSLSLHIHSRNVKYVYTFLFPQQSNNNN